MGTKDPGPYRVRLTRDGSDGYRVATQDGDLFTVDSIEFDDGVVSSLRVDLPGAGQPVPLAYSAGRKKLVAKLAKVLGKASVTALTLFIARENARKGNMYLPGAGWQTGVRPPQPGSRWKTARRAGGMALGGATVTHLDDIADLVRKPEEGYYDTSGRLVVRGMLVRSALVPRRSALDL